MTFPNNQGKNVRVIKNIADLPPVDGVSGKRILEDNITYKVGGDIIDDKLYIAGLNNTITADGGIDSSSWKTTASGGPMFEIENTNFRLFNVTVGARNATEVFNYTHVQPNADSLICRQMRFVDSNKVGTVESPFSVVIETVNSATCDDGITIKGSGVVASVVRLAAGLDSTGIAVDLNTSVYPTTEILNLVAVGTTGAIGVSGLPDSGNIPVGSLGQIDSCEFLFGTTPTENIFSDDIRWRIMNSPPLSDSTIKGILFFSGNTLVTSMATATPTRINTLWSTTDTDERISFGDKITFDNATNTLTSVDGLIDATGGAAFNHGKINGDIVELRDNGGLPSELSEQVLYYVGDVTATTFRLYEDSSLTSLVTFTDNGTEPNYYLHDTGNSASGWFVYIAERDTTLSIKTWVAIEKISGGAAQRRIHIMKSDTSYNVTVERIGSIVEAKNGIALSSVAFDLIDLKQYEGFLTYIENPADSVDNTCPESVSVVNIA